MAANLFTASAEAAQINTIVDTGSGMFTDFRVWDAKKGNYVFVKRYVTTGASNSFYLGTGSASNAVKDGLQKALKQIDKDKDKIIAVVK